MMYATESSNLQGSPRNAKKIQDAAALYKYAEAQNYDVYWYHLNLPGLESLSVMRPSDGKCFIALDPCHFQSEADELVKGLHEVGHCDTGAFYNEFAVCDVRQKHENKADKRAIALRLSAEDLDRAVAEGCTEIWALAEYFGVTEAFMRKAVCLYVHGNLAVDQYL